ncbi:M28 family peptidase [Salipiger abyssi]|uniref:M28 family peptidase n=1 Tax=Salipiger abyssi TaxID=1250539 RepID=UPI001A8C9A84|nr:M28 family peptidase [Salipiger abyssi]MBN9887194.1 M28 family peptidase [Salipiger abyssi]
MVDIDVMTAHLREFARWQKYSGSEEERKSFAYLQDRLGAYGFETELIEHDAYISLPGAARVEMEGEALRAITHSFGQPSGAAGLAGTLVYAGQGRPEDFAAIDARGKIALIEGIANPGAALAASRAGALGQIHISPHELLHEMCISPVWGNPEPGDLANMPTTVVCSVSNADGARLKALAPEGGATLFAEVETGWRKTPILIGERAPEGAAADLPFVLFSGHHDTWYYGVMDNGAANATMLEVARLCAQDTSGWKRGLRVAFWSGHSHGRYSGSTWYADNRWQELDRRCVAHVNVDSTGGMNSAVLENAESMSMLRGLAAEALREETGVEIRGERMARAGDQSFGGIGIPAMFMGFSQQGEGTDEAVIDGRALTIERRLPVGLGWWWHTPEDTIDKIDSELLARDTRVYVRVMAALLERPALPLDFAPLAEELDGLVAALAPSVADLLDLTPLRAALAGLREASAGEGVGDHRLMAASRALVPLDYTGGDRFGQEPALRLPAFPVLDPIRALAEAEGDGRKFHAVAATRARNRILHAIGLATEALTGA